MKAALLQKRPSKVDWGGRLFIIKLHSNYCLIPFILPYTTSANRTETAHWQKAHVIEINFQSIQKASFLVLQVDGWWRSWFTFYRLNSFFILCMMNEFSAYSHVKILFMEKNPLYQSWRQRIQLHVSVWDERNGWGGLLNYSGKHQSNGKWGKSFPHDFHESPKFD